MCNRLPPASPNCSAAPDVNDRLTIVGRQLQLVTFIAGSCKSPSHELAQGRSPRRARLPSRQSERGAAAGGARSDRAKGAAGFTFADAARMAGVSPAAPYRHFRDRDELLSSIAQRGFEQFETVLSQAWDDGRPDTVTAFERVGKAYLAFARNEPSFYSAMFESGIPIEANPALMAAGERAFAYQGCRGTACRAGAAGPAPPAGADDGAAHLVDVAWRRVAVRARRCSAPQAADVAGRSARSRSADLSAWSWLPDRAAAVRGKRSGGSKAGRSATGSAGGSLGQAEIKLRNNLSRCGQPPGLTKIRDGLGM